MKFTLSEKLSISLIAIIFIIDLFLPLGITVGALYMFCILLISKSSKKLIFNSAFVICILITIKFIIHVDAETSYIMYVNRFVSFTVVILAAVYSANFSKSYEKGNTEREAFAEKERNFNYLIENMIEGAQIIGSDWTYLYINKALEKQAGINKNDLIGKKMFEVYPGIQKSFMFKQLEVALKENKPVLIFNEFKFPDGHVDFFELNVQPIPEGLFIMSMIINDKVKLDNERKNYVQHLEEMLYMTSHMIRQPVTNIIGLADQLDLHENLSVEEIKQLNFIRKSAQDLDVFTHELNDFILKTIKNNRIKFIENEQFNSNIVPKEVPKEH